MAEQHEKALVPQIRFTGFTDPWEQRKLCEIAAFGGGHTPSMSDPDNYEGGNVLWVTSQDVKSYYLDGTTTQITEKGAKELTLYPMGALVMVTRSGILRHTLPVAELCKPSTVNQDIRVILPQEDKCCGKWLLQFFISRNKELLLEFGKTGTTVESVDFSKMKDMILRMPSLSEQRQIGLYFARLDNLITLHQRKYDKLCVLKKSMLDKMFPKGGSLYPEIRFAGFTDPWEQRKLGEFGSVAMCKRIYKEQTSEQGDVPFFKIGTFGANPDAFISNELFEDFKRIYPYPTLGTLLISAAGSIGRVVEYQGEKAYFQDSNIVWLEHDHRLNDAFLKPLYSRIEWGLEGSTIKRLYNKDLLSAEVTVPGGREQKEIGQFFAKLDKLITLHQRKLELLRNIKKSMLDKMFV